MSDAKHAQWSLHIHLNRWLLIEAKQLRWSYLSCNSSTFVAIDQLRAQKERPTSPKQDQTTQEIQECGRPCDDWGHIHRMGRDEQAPFNTQSWAPNSMLDDLHWSLKKSPLGQPTKAAVSDAKDSSFHCHHPTINGLRIWGDWHSRSSAIDPLWALARLMRELLGQKSSKKVWWYLQGQPKYSPFHLLKRFLRETM